jgi:HAD superfamily hydrolase (TIGR01509 family)
MFWSFRKRIKLICFDIDNTLCDFASAEVVAETYMSELISKDIHKMQLKVKKRNAIKNSCSAFTILRTFNDVKTYNLYRSFEPEKYSRALWFKETIERLDDSMVLGIDANKLIINAEVYEKKYWEQINSHLKNYPNAISTLEALKSKGFKIATITDSDGKKGIKDGRILNLGLQKYFDYIITGDDIGLNKPAVENWNKLLELSKLKAKECVMVGDHPDVDLATAKKLGFITVWTKEHLNTDLHQNYIDYEIQDIKELIAIIEKITGNKINI